MRRACPVVIAAAIALAVPARASGRQGLCGAAAGTIGPPYVAVLTAFPGELAPLVAAAEIDRTVTVDDRQYYEGRLEGVNVVLGLTGIGIVNATTRARSVVKHFPLVALVMNGVAGGQRENRVGDVAIASDWIEKDRKGVFHPNPALVALAQRGSTALAGPLVKCTTVRPSVSRNLVCLSYDPRITFGGLGMSGDDSGGEPIGCVPGPGAVFGCDLPQPMVATLTTAVDAAPDLVDMETAAVARAAARRRLPFLGVRAMSDGPGDPFGNRGINGFFDFWRLAAENASLMTRATLAELHRLAEDPAGRSTCRLLARHDWRRAARRLAGSTGG